MFYIEYLVNKDVTPLSVQLLETSYELVSLTLIYWTNREKFTGSWVDASWPLMCYAAPAAGVLCKDLLRRNADPATLRHIGNNSPAFTKSNLIQQLSMLVGFLDWIGTSSSNSKICVNIKKAIRQALDQTLNEGMPQNAERVSVLNEFEIESMADVNDFFNFELLHTFDWLWSENES